MNPFKPTLYFSINLLILSLISSLTVISQNRISLFNGKNFTGWTTVGDEAPFTVEDGSIVLHQKINTPEHSFLRTSKRYRNFILELDCKRDSLFYYGIVFRARKAPDTAHVRLYGYQIKVDHIPTRRWTGGIFDDFGTSWNWMYPLTDNVAAQQALNPAGSWDHYRIEAMGNHIKVWVNEVEAVNMVNTKYRNGYIALKIHMLGDHPAMEKPAAWIKHIMIITKRLNNYSIKMDLPEKVVKG